MTEANKHLSINKDFIINDPQWDQQNIDQNMKLLLSMIDVIAKQFPNKHLIEYDLYIKTSDQNCLENLSVSLFNFGF
jgi:hypothetical protein